MSSSRCISWKISNRLRFRCFPNAMACQKEKNQCYLLLPEWRRESSGEAHKIWLSNDATVPLFSFSLAAPKFLARIWKRRNTLLLFKKSAQSSNIFCVCFWRPGKHALEEWCAETQSGHTRLVSQQIWVSQMHELVQVLNFLQRPRVTRSVFQLFGSSSV